MIAILSDIDTFKRCFMTNNASGMKLYTLYVTKHKMPITQIAS